MRSAWTAIRESFYRLAATGLVPARLFLPVIPPASPRSGPLSLEIVTHCWNYAHLLAFQLSSLALHPPEGLTIRMTVFHSPRDERTGDLLAFFGGMSIPGVRWNWQPLEESELFRRGIGRNRAARATTADWIWFTDCDVVFPPRFFEGLAKALQGRTDRLIYPRHELVSQLLSEDDPLLTATMDGPRIVELDPRRFRPDQRGRATGPFQIVHGDVARGCGYCESTHVWQEPAEHWQKAHEDRIFRWLIRTQGEPIDIAPPYRIRHVSKGRYRSGEPAGRIRKAIRRIGDRLRLGDSERP
ncbi:MAG TPA: glycosyltransferase [Thermoanaerobaculia bacterium]|nr:glycosyltransferase [Thermoanaerobaculia bacterium]